MRSRRRKGGILVVAIDEKLTAYQLENLSKAISASGIKALIVPLNCRLAAVGQNQTFFRSGHCPKLKCIADGKEMDRVQWCETSHGLVCQIDKSGQMTVRQFRSVRVEPVKADISI